jgi:hypothetical protein
MEIDYIHSGFPFVPLFLFFVLFNTYSFVIEKSQPVINEMVVSSCNLESYAILSIE